MHRALASPDSQFLCCTCVYTLCDILWPEVQSHYDSSHIHASGLRSACAHAQARPTNLTSSSIDSICTIAAVSMTVASMMSGYRVVAITS